MYTLIDAFRGRKAKTKSQPIYAAQETTERIVILIISQYKYII